MLFEALLFLKVNRSLWDASTVGKAMGRTRECEEAVDYIDIDDNDSGGGASEITRRTFSWGCWCERGSWWRGVSYYYDEMEYSSIVANSKHWIQKYHTPVCNKVLEYYYNCTPESSTTRPYCRTVSVVHVQYVWIIYWYGMFTAANLGSTVP